MLAGYIQFISDIVVQDSLENIRNQLEVKTRFEKERLALDRVKLKINWIQIFNDSITHWRLPMQPELKSRFTVMAVR